MSWVIVQQVLLYVLSPGVILSILILIHNSRLKVDKNDKLLHYINDETAQAIEQRKFELSWGKLSLNRKLELVEIDASADFEITYYPAKKLETPLPCDWYCKTFGGNGKRIFVVNKRLMRKKKVKEIFVLSKTPLPTTYRDKIDPKFFPTSMEIVNSNELEIRNYTCKLPNSIKMTKLASAKDFISDVRIEIAFPYLQSILGKAFEDCPSEGATALVTLSEPLPARKGDSLGKLKFDLI